MIKLLEMEFNCKYYSYLIKSIALPFEKLYKTISIEKVKLLIKRMKWKAHLYENSGLNSPIPLNYNFKCRKCPLQHRDLTILQNQIH